MATFLNSFQSEWLKRKRSAATWLVVGGACFIPAILVIAQLVNHDGLAQRNALPQFWEKHMMQSWQSMAIALLPMGIILVTSLLAQIEYRNNGWKQLHATPQSRTLIFFTKLSVILVMMAAFLLLFNIGIYLSGVFPAMVLPGIHLPSEPFPLHFYIVSSIHFFIASLPIIGLQQLISLHYHNFLASVGIGLSLIVASLFALSWKYGYTLPFTHAAIHFMKLQDENKVSTFMPMAWLSLIYFVVFILTGYAMFMGKRQRG